MRLMNPVTDYWGNGLSQVVKLIVNFDQWLLSQASCVIRWVSHVLIWVSLKIMP